MSEPYLGDNLIFVVSQPRSGSTLLQRILSGHRDVESSAETWLMLQPAFGDREGGLQAEYGHDWSLLARNDFLANYTDGVGVYDDAVRAYARVFYDNALAKSGGTIFLEKTPRYSLIIPELYRLFPNAKFVFLLRNPLAVMASILNSFVKDNWHWLQEFKVDLLKSPQCLLDGIELLGDKAIVLRYEDLVADPAAQTKQLCDRLGIEFNEAMLDYSKTPEAKGFMTDRVGVQQHDRPTDKSIDKWQQLKNDPQHLLLARDYLDALGNDVLERLGYSRASLDAGLGNAKVEGNVLPLRLLMQPGEHLSLRDAYVCCRWDRKRRFGPVAGELMAIAELLSETARRTIAAFRKTPG